MLQVRGHKLPEYHSIRDGNSYWTATAILHISRHKTITVKVTNYYLYCINMIIIEPQFTGSLFTGSPDLKIENFSTIS